MKVEGGCFCGAVRYSAEGDAMMKGQCHCRNCQTISGGAFNIFMVMPKSGFSYTKGQPKQFSRGSDVKMPATREFCDQCGTHLVTLVDAMPEVTILKVGTLDEPAQFGGPDMAIFLAEKQAFHTIPTGIAHYDGMPG